MAESTAGDLPPPPPKKRRPLWLWLLVALLVVLIGGAIAAAILVPRWLLETVKTEARKQGVELTRCTLTPGLDQLLLEGCYVAADGELKASGTVDIIAIALVDFAPSHVDVTGAKLNLRVSTELRHILENRASTGSETPLHVHNAEAEVFISDVTSPSVKLSAVNYSSTTGVATADFIAPDLAQGTLSIEPSGIRADFSLLSSLDTPIQANLVYNQTQGVDRSGRQLGLGATLSLSAKQLPIKALHVPLIVEIPEALESVVVDFSTTIDLPDRARAGQARGRFQSTLRGLHFPVPREVQGLIYGDTATLGGDFKLDRSYSKADLLNLELRKAALTMKGSGRLRRAGLGVAIEAELRGDLSCQAIARSAATTELSPELAKLAKTIARKALKGGVGLAVRLEAHSARLESAKIAKAVGVGCGFRALSIPDAVQLGDEVLNQLPKLPFPELTDELPKPQLPKFKLPAPRLPFPFPGSKGLVPAGSAAPSPLPPPAATTASSQAGGAHSAEAN